MLRRCLAPCFLWYVVVVATNDTTTQLRSRELFVTSSVSKDDQRELQGLPVVPFDTGAIYYNDYFDTTPSHSGNCDTSSEVDSKFTTDSTCVTRGGACAVGWTQPTEWLSYYFTVNSGTTAVDIVVRASSASTSKQLTVDVDEAVSSTFNAPGLGFDTYADLTWSNVPVTTGDHTVSISFLNSNINVCSISVYQAGNSGPSPTPAPPSPSAPSPSVVEPFLLKLYWQYAYLWQGEKFERKWCLQCDDGTPGCQTGDSLRIRVCDDDPNRIYNTEFEFVETTAGVVRIRDPVSNTCMTGETSGSNANRIRMRTCSDSRADQTWWTAGLGSFTDGGRFELHPAGTTDLCATIHHHPRDGEVLFLRPCYLPRRDTTSYWNLYYP
jgi:hypothetical protein